MDNVTKFLRDNSGIAMSNEGFQRFKESFMEIYTATHPNHPFDPFTNVQFQDMLDECYLPFQVLTDERNHTYIYPTLSPLEDNRYDGWLAINADNPADTAASSAYMIDSMASRLKFSLAHTGRIATAGRFMVATRPAELAEGLKMKLDEIDSPNPEIASNQAYRIAHEFLTSIEGKWFEDHKDQLELKRCIQLIGRHIRPLMFKSIEVRYEGEIQIVLNECDLPFKFISDSGRYRIINHITVKQ